MIVQGPATPLTMGSGNQTGRPGRPLPYDGLSGPAVPLLMSLCD